MKKITRREALKRFTTGVSAAAVIPGINQEKGINLSKGFADFNAPNSAAQVKTSRKPLVRVVFVRPDVDRYWLGWPGTSFDIRGHQVQYTKVLTDAANKFGTNLEIINDPLKDSDTVNAFLNNLKLSPPDGIVIISMSLNQSWPHIDNMAKNHGEIPMVVFSQMGTSFTQHLQGTRNIKGVTVGATQDVGWLNFAMRMLNTIWQMNNTRICVMRGKETLDQKIMGTTIHYIPRSRFPQELKNTEITGEMQDLADLWESKTEKIVEPNREDRLNAAKNYIIARRIMEAENCQGISMDCLGLVGDREIPCPPCMAWVQLLDDGYVGTCEAAAHIAVSQRLTSLLFDRPGFMQDPAPNTINNTLMVAHCTSPTRLDGFGMSQEPFILRSHSESNIGVSPQVLWRIGQKVTIMQLNPIQQVKSPVSSTEKAKQVEQEPSILLGTGRVLRNIDTPPAGGCRTSMELELDGVPDARDTKGFHQLIIYGDLEIPFKSYCELAGIKVEHI